MQSTMMGMLMLFAEATRRTMCTTKAHYSSTSCALERNGHFAAAWLVLHAHVAYMPLGQNAITHFMTYTRYNSAGCSLECDGHVARLLLHAHVGLQIAEAPLRYCPAVLHFLGICQSLQAVNKNETQMQT